MNSITQQIIESGRLVRVEEFSLSGHSGLAEVVLTFESLTLFVSAVAENDTIAVSLNSIFKESDTVSAVITNMSLWRDVYGFNCIWVWLLTNQQEYIDGIRFEFFSDGEFQIIELIVIGSALHRYKLIKDGYRTSQNLPEGLSI